MPITGCPHLLDVVKVGYHIKRINDSIVTSIPTHLSSRFYNNSIRIDVCFYNWTKSKVNLPKVNYCIYKYHGACAEGFAEVSLQQGDNILQMEDSKEILFTGEVFFVFCF